MLVTCLNCGNNFDKKNGQIKRSPNHFCNRSCTLRWRWSNDYNLIQKRKLKYCLNCEKQLSNSKPRFCSNRCASKYNLDQRREDIFLNKDKAWPATLKKLLIEERGVSCEECHLKEWLGQPLPLQLHHINGNADDNRRENLKLLCPNCHVCTVNWGNKNKAIHKRATRRNIKRKLLG